MNLDRVVFVWGVSPYYGWGVIGRSFKKYWPGYAVSYEELPPSALELTSCPQDSPVFIGLGNNLAASNTLRGTPSIAFPVFEDVEQARANIDQLREYPIVITASNWNHDVLAELGMKSRMVNQGYDPELFHPGIRKPLGDGRFHVFSGGKAEHRKGQDLVLQGFKIFADKHDDAVLHAAWASPWPQLARSFAQTEIGEPPQSPNGMVNFSAWAQFVGIKRKQFVVVPATPNHLMPDVLAGMDCAVFASRLEGGTNICAMECIGAGIPTILSWSTGHRDLPHHYTLSPCTPETIAEGLECIYQSPALLRPAAIDEFAWPVRIAELVEVLKDA